MRQRPNPTDGRALRPPSAPPATACAAALCAALLLSAGCVDPDASTDGGGPATRGAGAGDTPSAGGDARVPRSEGAGADDDGADAPTRGAPVHGYRVVARFPHDPGAFTQGLLYADGGLYESTGQYGRSTLRFVELETGRVQRLRRLPPDVFAEGLAMVDRNLVQLTWTNRRALVFEADTFENVGQFPYVGEGWGLAYDGTRLILSDGSARLRFYHPQSFAPLGELLVTDEGRPVEELNELEVIDGLLWANVWHSDSVARIDLASGRVLSWVDLSGLIELPPEMQGGEPQNVLNGIAWDAENERLFVTGKHWPALFQIEVEDAPRR